MSKSIGINESKAVATVMGLLAVPGISGQEKAVAAQVKKLLRQAGVPSRAMRFDGAEKRMKMPRMKCGNLIVDIPGDGRPRRAFSAHMDTVTLVEGSKAVRKGGKVVSKGDTALGADDRSGVAALVSGLRTVLGAKMPHPPLRLIFTVGEEIGLFGARYVDRKAIKGIKYAYNFDGSSPAGFNMGAPSASDFYVEITGLASHAGGAPEKGASAVAAGAAAVADIKRSGWFGKIKKGRNTGTSNIGVFRAEGPTNIVSPRCYIEAEARSHSDAFLRRIAAAWKEAFEKAARSTRSVSGVRCKAKFRREHCYKTFVLKESAPVVQLAFEAAAIARVKPVCEVGGGGLDANYFNQYGMPTLTLGAGGRDAHTVAESMNIKDHLAGVRMAVALMTV